MLLEIGEAPVRFNLLFMHKVAARELYSNSKGNVKYVLINLNGLLLLFAIYNKLYVKYNYVILDAKNASEKMLYFFYLLVPGHFSNAIYTLMVVCDVMAYRGFVYFHICFHILTDTTSTSLKLSPTSWHFRTALYVCNDTFPLLLRLSKYSPFHADNYFAWLDIDIF